VLVTHDEAIASRCQRVLRLHQGKLIEENPGALPD
jgi:putative ABC transport system ATP-binding protein